MRCLRRLLPALLFLALASVAWAVDSDLSATLAKSRFVEDEYSLAQKSRFYAVIDLTQPAIVLKARGVVFKTWKILSVEALGSGIPRKVLTVAKRSAMAPPERIILKPESDEEAAAKLAATPAPPPGTPPAGPPPLDALEVTDMPTQYDIQFSDNVVVDVSQPITDRWEKFKVTAKEVWEKALLPLRRLTGKVPVKKGIELRILMSGPDAQATYWALPEGTEVLFWAEPKK